MSDDKGKASGSQNKGKNLGQGLAGVNDNQRRDLAGKNPPTKDQAGLRTSGEQGRGGGETDGSDSGSR